MIAYIYKIFAMIVAYVRGWLGFCIPVALTHSLIRLAEKRDLGDQRLSAVRMLFHIRSASSAAAVAAAASSSSTEQTKQKQKSRDRKKEVKKNRKLFGL